jgi:hypothetical protein
VKTIYLILFCLLISCIKNPTEPAPKPISRVSVDVLNWQQTYNGQNNTYSDATFYFTVTNIGQDTIYPYVLYFEYYLEKSGDHGTDSIEYLGVNPLPPDDPQLDWVKITCLWKRLVSIDLYDTLLNQWP